MKNYLLMIISVIILSQAANLVKLSTSHPLVMCFWRLSLASLILGGLSWYQGSLKELKHMSLKHIRFLILTTLFLATHFYLWFGGIKLTSVSNSAVLFATNPLFTTLGAWIFFKEKINQRTLIAFALAMIGILLTFSGQAQFADWIEFNWSQQMMGDSLVFLSSLLFSAYVLSSKKMRQDFSNLPFTFILNLSVALSTLILIIIARPDLLYSSYTTNDWLSFILMAIFPSVLGHALMTYALHHVKVSIMSCTMLASPILAALGANFLYGEVVKESTWWGFGFIAIGLFYLYLPLKLYWKTKNQ